MNVFPAEPPLIAHEAPLSLWVLTWLQAIEDVFVLIDADAATRAATGADTVLRVQPPDALFVQEVFAAQCADGAQIHDVACQLVIAGIAGENIDLFVGSAADDLQFGSATDFTSKPDTSRAHNTAIGEQRDLIADVVLIRLDVLRFLQAAVTSTVFVAVILQTAFARLITDGTIQRMIEQQVFQSCLLGGLYLFAVRNDHRAVFNRCLATGEQLRLHGNRAVGLLVAHFDEAHAATGDHRQIVVIAVVRNLNPRSLGRLNAVQPLGGTDFDRLIVDDDCWHRWRAGLKGQEVGHSWVLVSTTGTGQSTFLKSVLRNFRASNSTQ